MLTVRSVEPHRLTVESVEPHRLTVGSVEPQRLTVESVEPHTLIVGFVGHTGSLNQKAHSLQNSKWPSRTEHCQSCKNTTAKLAEWRNADGGQHNALQVTQKV